MFPKPKEREKEKEESQTAATNPPVMCVRRGEGRRGDTKRHKRVTYHSKRKSKSKRDECARLKKETSIPQKQTTAPTTTAAAAACTSGRTL